MIEFGFRFHHFGLVVRAPEPAFRYLDALGYRAGHQVFDPLQRAHVAMRHHAQMPDVEVIWPGDAPSPVDRMVKRGEGRIYHLCYTADDPQGAIGALEAAGLEVLPISEPVPALLFGNAPVSFHHVEGFGLIELIHPVKS